MKKQLINLSSTLLEDLSKEDINEIQINIINSIPYEERLNAFGKIKKFEKLIKGLVDSILKEDAKKIFIADNGGVESLGFGGLKYQLVQTNKYKYSDEYYKLESELKALKDYEQKTGIAKLTETTETFKCTVL